SRALEILAILERDYRHPIAGFEEANPPRTPLCSNPHMHLFEAMLAWEEQDRDGPWSALADEIAGLALSRFIDGGNGGLREFFAYD
ncbi:AGE family epimerase/isomerase, partial [Klebsiella pneumoniae]|nr:AGE family epimerase/isomerase [Klebsiella pneumoniae]